MTATSVTPAPAARARTARPRSALWPLARVEGRRLLRHPVFLVGAVVSSATVLLASGELSRRGVPMGALDRTELVSFLAGDAFVMVGGAFWTFLATFLAASRERRDAAEDFYAGQPVSQPVRTAAALLSVGYAGLAALALVAVSTLVFLGVDGAVSVGGRRYTTLPLDLLQGPLYVVFAGVLGVLAGTWTRHVYPGVFAAVALFLPPVALVPWLLLDDDFSRGFYGAFMSHLPGVGWRLLGMAGLAVLAGAVAFARSSRGLGVGVVAGAGLAAVVAFAIAAPSNGFGAACAAADDGSDGAASGLNARADAGNLDFERGDLSGWHTHTVGGSGWRAYDAGYAPPGQPAGDPRLPVPPQGRFAALTDPCGPGTRILYRDLALDGRSTLRFKLHYQRYSSQFGASGSLDQSSTLLLRVDIMDTSAPILSVAAADVLATVYRTMPGDKPELGPRPMRFDLSPWEGRTVRLRFATVDADSPVRAVVDDVRLDPAH